MAKFAALFCVILFAVGCGKSPSQKLTMLSEEFVYSSLAFSPSSATAAGLHQYQKQNLDEMLDDLSEQNLARQRTFYEKFRDLLADLNSGELTPEDRADLVILQDQIALNLLDLTEIHSHQHSPQLYVETLGNALFAPYVLEYAPKPDRVRHIIARLQKVPLYLDQAASNLVSAPDVWDQVAIEWQEGGARVRHIIARLQKVPLYLDQAASNLVSAPDVWDQVAIEENQGNMNLVDKEIRAGIPPGQTESYARSARVALDAMTKFDRFLRNSLHDRNNHDWRLGGNVYTRKFRYMLQSGSEADDTLQHAERDLITVRARMLELALPLHRAAFPSHKDHTDLTGADRENAVIGEVLGKIADRHADRDSYLDDARKDLDEARAFVGEKHLLRLPPRANLQVIPTPEFMRGSYPVGGFNAAPALEPQLGAFYWVTPIPPSWPKERVDSKLREYNFYKLKLLPIHEAMPGHYVQMEIANDVQPKARRVLRSVFGNGPYIEGWAQYSTQAMLDEGFLAHSPELALPFGKGDLA